MLSLIAHPDLLAAVSKPLISAQQLAGLAAIIAVTTILMIRLRRKGREAGSDPRSYARELQARLREEKSTIGEAEEVMRELDTLARQIHGRIDTRFARLESIIRDADRRIETLSRLVRHAQGMPTLDVVCDESQAKGTPARDEKDPAATDAGDTPSPERRLQAEVIRLAEAGLDARKIAHETGRAVGEVELILALRKTRTQAAAV
jgi:hypothetical protein